MFGLIKVVSKNSFKDSRKLFAKTHELCCTCTGYVLYDDRFVYNILHVHQALQYMELLYEEMKTFSHKTRHAWIESHFLRSFYLKPLHYKNIQRTVVHVHVHYMLHVYRYMNLYMFYPVVRSRNSEDARILPKIRSPPPTSTQLNHNMGHPRFCRQVRWQVLRVARVLLGVCGSRLRRSGAMCVRRESAAAAAKVCCENTTVAMGRQRIPRCSPEVHQVNFTLARSSLWLSVLSL